MSITVVNTEDYIPNGDYNPHAIRPYLLGHDYGYGFAIVYAQHLQDACDIAADADGLRSLALSREDVAELEHDGYAEDVIIYLGNASEPYDSEHLYCAELPNLSPDTFTHMDNSDIHRLAK